MSASEETGAFRRVHVVINPASGGDEPILNTLNDVFGEGGIAWDVSLTRQSGDGARLAAEAAAGGADLVAAYGGDGTVMDVVGGLIGTGVPLAILPGGTGNALAAGLGIPTNLAEAARLIVSGGALRASDVGRIEGRHFLLRAGVGFEATVTESASRELKDRFGLLAYGIGLFQALQTPDTASYHLRLDGEAVRARGWSCMIVNTGSLGRLKLEIPDIEPDDGYLDVILLSEQLSPWLSMAATLIDLRAFAATLPRWKVREAHIEAEPPQPIHADGELLEQATPVTARVLPQAVRVLVPAQGAARASGPGAGG